MNKFLVLSLAVIIAALIVSISSWADTNDIVEQMTLDREYQKESEYVTARVKRIQKLAYDCAAVATRDYSLDESAIWLALTGDRDLDDTLSYTDPNISEKIFYHCYSLKYKDDKYDDVRAYMYSH